jgi:hypothetical protein
MKNVYVVVDGQRVFLADLIRPFAAHTCRDLPTLVAQIPTTPGCGPFWKSDPFWRPEHLGKSIVLPHNGYSVTTTIYGNPVDGPKLNKPFIDLSHFEFLTSNLLISMGNAVNAQSEAYRQGNAQAQGLFQWYQAQYQRMFNERLQMLRTLRRNQALLCCQWKRLQPAKFLSRFGSTGAMSLILQFLGRRKDVEYLRTLSKRSKDMYPKWCKFAFGSPWNLPFKALSNRFQIGVPSAKGVETFRLKIGPNTMECSMMPTMANDDGDLPPHSTIVVVKDHPDDDVFQTNVFTADKFLEKFGDDTIIIGEDQTRVIAKDVRCLTEKLWRLVSPNGKFPNDMSGKRITPKNLLTVVGEEYLMVVGTKAGFPIIEPRSGRAILSLRHRSHLDTHTCPDDFMMEKSLGHIIWDTLLEVQNRWSKGNPKERKPEKHAWRKVADAILPLALNDVAHVCLKGTLESPKLENYDYHVGCAVFYHLVKRLFKEGDRMFGKNTEGLPELSGYTLASLLVQELANGCLFQKFVIVNGDFFDGLSQSLFTSAEDRFYIHMNTFVFNSGFQIPTGRLDGHDEWNVLFGPARSMNIKVDDDGFVKGEGYQPEKCYSFHHRVNRLFREAAGVDDIFRFFHTVLSSSSAPTRITDWCISNCERVMKGKLPQHIEEAQELAFKVMGHDPWTFPNKFLSMENQCPCQICPIFRPN